MNKKDTLQINQLNKTNSIILSKPLIQILGLDAALVFSELLNQYNYIKSTGNGKCTMFTYTVARMKDELHLSERRQHKAIDKLKDYGILRCYKYHYPFNQRRIIFVPYGIEKLEKDIENCLTKYKEKKNYYSNVYKENESENKIKYSEFLKNNPYYGYIN